MNLFWHTWHFRQFLENVRLFVHLMQFTLTVSGISMYNQIKKNEKCMQNISRHKLKDLDLEYPTNFSNIFEQLTNIFQTLNNDRLWRCTLSYPNLMVYCIAFKILIFIFCTLSSFLKELFVGWCQTFIHVYVAASFFFIITASVCANLKMSWSQLFYLFPLIIETDSISLFIEQDALI